jgi:hypothetical protein
MTSLLPRLLREPFSASREKFEWLQAINRRSWNGKAGLHD